MGGQAVAIAAIEDPVIRNLRITERYSQLSAAIRDQIGESANWCTFATWASRQAGCTIRGEDFGDLLADALRGSWTLRHPFIGLWRVLLRRGLFNPHTRLGRIVKEIHSPFDAFERASAAVAIGNRKVFEEVGQEIARYLEICAADPSIDSPRFKEFLASLPEDALRRAFTHYQRQRTEPQPSQRAQFMLLANLEILIHEQTRLQPEIQRGMEAGPATAEDLESRLASLVPGGKLLLIPAKRLRRFARALTRQIISGALMVLRMPNIELHLGSNLDAPTPAVFVALDNPDLMALVKSIEPPDAACDNCGVEDWADLRQRVHYIFHLFRAFHERKSLFDPPFTPEQAAAFHQGRIPDGRL